ncbi:hypothetical protein P8452_42662 [Trifolium repens]|nr:hypothetical protein P8452_42662 [Trifolium repens]
MFGCGCEAAASYLSSTPAPLAYLGSGVGFPIISHLSSTTSQSKMKITPIKSRLLEFRVFNTALREGKVIGFDQLLSVVQDVCCLPFNPLKIRSILQEGEKIVLIEKGACYILFKSFKNPIICHEKDVSLEILYQGS